MLFKSYGQEYSYENHGYIYDGSIWATFNAVPVFNLKFDILYSSGNGQIDEPYVIDFATNHQITTNNVTINSGGSG